MLASDSTPRRHMDVGLGVGGLLGRRGRGAWAARAAAAAIRELGTTSTPPLDVSSARWVLRILPFARARAAATAAARAASSAAGTRCGAASGDVDGDAGPAVEAAAGAAETALIRLRGSPCHRPTQSGCAGGFIIAFAPLLGRNRRSGVTKRRA